MHLLVVPDDPPVGHQNIPQDLPQEILEKVDPAVGIPWCQEVQNMFSQ